jgi:hypothetical protein
MHTVTLGGGGTAGDSGGGAGAGDSGGTGAGTGAGGIGGGDGLPPVRVDLGAAFGEDRCGVLRR